MTYRVYASIYSCIHFILQAACALAALIYPSHVHKYVTGDSFPCRITRPMALPQGKIIRSIFFVLINQHFCLKNELILIQCNCPSGFTYDQISPEK
ncbi:hypothetical protein EAP67_16940 [Salmonella enterica]|nr:hypothetical protein [Salmonella enterica]